MKTAEWLARELSASRQTPFEFFVEAWETVFQKKCASNLIVIDANKYRRNGTIPYYVSCYYEKQKEGARTFHAHA